MAAVRIVTAVLKKKRTIWETAAWILGFAAAFIGIRYYITAKPDFHDVILKMANEANKSYPQVVDAFTRADSIIPGLGNDFSYHMTITSDSSTSLSATSLAPLEGMIRNSYCTSPEMAVFRNAKTAVSWAYFDASGRFITKFTMTPNLCN